jgi:hypothetical protein
MQNENNTNNPEQAGQLGSLSVAGGSPPSKREIPEELRQQVREACEWVCKSTVTFSVLYDLDRLPEQVEEGTREWGEMLIIVQHMKAAYEEGKASLANATSQTPPKT